MYMETKNIDVKTSGRTFFSMGYYDYAKRKEYGGNRGVHKIIRIPQRPNSLRSV